MISIVYFIQYGNRGVSSSISDPDHNMIIRKLVDSILNILLVFIDWWEVQMYFHRAFLP
jgi:hypothetical protein